MNDPERSPRSRTSAYSLEVLTISAPTLLAPEMAWASMDIRADTAVTPGIPSVPIAVASPWTKVELVSPAKPPPCDVVAAALDSMKIRSAPNPWILSVTPFCVPCPMAISKITELTPIINPREVRALRSLLAKIARNAILTVSRTLTGPAPRLHRLPPGEPGRQPSQRRCPQLSGHPACG